MDLKDIFFETHRQYGEETYYLRTWTLPIIVMLTLVLLTFIAPFFLKLIDIAWSVGCKLSHLR